MGELGATGYTVYAAAVGGRSVRGEPLPEFQRTPGKVQDAWDQAARAIARKVLREMADQIDRGPSFPLAPSIISELVRERAMAFEVADS